jgi:hypothetical protein
MAQEHVEALTAVRDRLIEQRRRLADSLAKPDKRDDAERVREFVEIQNAIDAIKKAIAEEEPPKTPIEPDVGLPSQVGAGGPDEPWRS